MFESFRRDTKEGRRIYWEAISSDLSTGIDINKKVIYEIVLRNSTFIDWVRDTFIMVKFRAVKYLRKYKTKEEII